MVVYRISNLERSEGLAPVMKLVLLHTTDLDFSNAWRQSVTGAKTDWIRQKPPSHGLGLSWQEANVCFVKGH